MAILNAGGNPSVTSGFEITAESGYYTLSDGGNVTLTQQTGYWTMSWS